MITYKPFIALPNAHVISLVRTKWHIKQREVSNLVWSSGTYLNSNFKGLQIFSFLFFFYSCCLLLIAVVFIKKLRIFAQKHLFYTERFLSAVSRRNIFPVFSISLLASATLTALELKRNVVCLVQTEEKERTTKMSLAENIQKL